MKLLGNSAGIAIAAVSLAIPALAQDMRTASENVVACQDVADAAERLACFESAASVLSSLLVAPVQETAKAPEAPVATITAPVQQAAAPAASQAEQALVAASATTDAPIQQAAADTPQEADAPRSGLPSWIPRITFGSDRDVEKEPDEYETQLTRIQVNRIGRHFFTTNDGLVLKQRKPGGIRAPKTLPADIVLYQNIAGGLQLKVVETNRIYSVTRVE